MIKNIKFKIEGMTCGGCAKGVRGAILNIDGVSSSEIDFDTKTAEVEFDDEKINENHIFKAVEDMNYKVVK